jgi:hypothetical protein
MQLWSYGLGFMLALGLGVGVGGGCAAATGQPGATGVGGSGAGTTGTTGTSGVSSSGTGAAGGAGVGGAGAGGATVLTDSGVPDGFGSCATFSAQAQQAPAAMLIALQRSASMSTDGKWPAAQSAIVQAIDEDVFDTMSLGLTAFPKGQSAPPACLEGLYPYVYCGIYDGSATDPIPIPIAAAGTAKSTAPSGVRHDILQWLNSNMPETDDPSNSSPIYDALNAGYQVLQGTNIAKRIAVLITDGGFDCTSVSNPTRPGISDGLCADWEYPTTVNALITAARTNATAPIDTFIVGVPGSNSDGENQGAWSTAPGSPSTVPSNCDSTAVWSQTGAAPAVPCHIDLSNGSTFNAAALADAITTLRAKDLGCVYALPTPPVGQTISTDEVNVEIIINGVTYVIPKRSDPTDTCLTSSDPCWDYNAQGQVELIGITCSTVSTTPSAEVEIFVGCATILN